MVRLRTRTRTRTLFWDVEIDVTLTLGVRTTPSEHPSVAELVRPLLLPREQAAEGHHALADRLLGRLRWDWRESDSQGRCELVSRDRAASVDSRGGLLPQATVVVLAAELEGLNEGLSTEVLAAAAVLLSSGAVRVGSPSPAHTWRSSAEETARYLAQTGPYDFRTCLGVVMTVGDPVTARSVLQRAEIMREDPMRLAQAQAHVLERFDREWGREEDYLLGEIRTRYRW